MTDFDPEKITFFAKTDARGQGVQFGIKAKDRQRHMYVVGKTGMGKSTLLENMAAQDIQNGEGMAFIDPHGSAAETLLEYVPEHRVKDVVYFAPFDLDHPVSFNVMEDVGPDKRHLVVSGLMSTFKKIWVDAWSARMEYILTNALLALIEYPDTTLLSVNRLFVDKAYRKEVVAYIKDPAVKSFWEDEFANYTDRFTAEALPAIQNKIGQFTGNPLIRNIIGQPHSSFNIRQMMDEKKILIMNLSKGLIGETNANLLGSMLTTRIYLAAMSRADLPVAEMKQMPNFYFYVDEFQSFANSTFANILSEARKYHLNLIIAHQYIEQMEEDVRNAVFGNVGTTIAFRVGPFDAEVLETVFAPRFEANDLVNLGFAQIYLTLMIDGIGSAPFSATTLPPISLPEISCREMVIAESRDLYAKNRSEVEKLVDELHTPKKPEKPNNDKRPSGQKKNGANKKEWNGNQSERRERPVQKTPEDLRAVLMQMKEDKSPNVSNGVSSEVSNTESYSKPETVAEVQKPTNAYEPKSNHATQNSGKRMNHTKAPRWKNNDKTQPQVTKKLMQQGDGQTKNHNALAAALQQAGVVQPSAVSNTSESSDAVTSLEKQTEYNQKVSNHTKTKQSLFSKQTKYPKQQKAFAQSEKTPIRKVVIEQRRYSKPDTSIDNAYTGSVSQRPASQSVVQDADALNPSKIKRMLQQSETGRTPFTQ